MSTSKRCELLVVRGRVREYGYPFRILIDSGASKNFARRQSVARNADKFGDALRENSGAGPVFVRLANESLVEVPMGLMDLSFKFEDFDSTERFIILKMDNYDLTLGMPWLERHEPWIDWRGKAIGASRPALSDRALMSLVPTSVKSKGVRQGRQGASAPEGFMGVAEVFGVPEEVTVNSVKESAEAPPGVKPSEPREVSRSGWVSYPACGATNSVDPDTGSRRAVRASTERMLRAAHQVGNLVPPEQGISRREPCMGVEILLRQDDDVLKEFKKQRTSRLGSAILKNPKDPVYPLVKNFEDVVSKDPPSQLPPDRGIKHEVDHKVLCHKAMAPATRAVGGHPFLAAKVEAGMLRDSKSPHSSSTFCLRKPNGKWRLIHA
ncbi:unnamed protein product [Phytophthora fragariaefolia]|uniref:Unnamed protein product n=1 Tax=Phytophthora fragariaefolia TaxID=1490495 RepID=A0A9W7CUL2_9STRA|nr:unnamed protein product [Phytophthora fragariaefolia]